MTADHIEGVIVLPAGHLHSPSLESEMRPRGFYVRHFGDVEAEAFQLRHRVGEQASGAQLGAGMAGFLQN